MPAAGMDQQSSETLAMTYGVLSREQRKQMFGLDCPEQLEWRHWNPGTEYAKQLVIKNVSTSVLKMRFKQPTSKAFSMEFPEPFKLRPGMSQSLKVIFRPLKLQHYSDNVELFVGNASFLVPVHAYTPVTHIEVPPSLDFGFTPTKETATAPLVVRNSGDVRVDVTWRLEPPFAISPPSASLAPGEALTFAVAFTPPEACSYTANAACELESGAAAICKISGIGKFPYLSVEQAGVDFGPVVVGQRVERMVRFGNHSMVPANFTVSHDPDGPDDGVFTLGPARGTLGPEEYSVLRVSYTPRSTGTFSSETFHIGTSGGNTVSLNLRGTAVAPTITLSARAFNFGNVAVGATSSRVLYIRNHSAVPVPYDFQVEPLDVFAISRVRGVLAPEATAHVTITFRAALPSNYWRRLALLLKDAEPQGIDLVATSYSDKSRPPPLSHRHVDRYLARVSTGAPPVEDLHLESAPPSAAAGLYSQEGDAMPPMPPTLPPLTAETTGGLVDGTAAEEGGSAAKLVGPDGWPLVFFGQDPGGAVRVDTDTLDFGSCSRLSAAEYRSVTVTNTTPAKLTAFVVVPDWLDPGAGPGEAPRQVFQVFPESTDIRPRGQVTFKVAFRPPRDGAFFAQQLLLVAHVKSQRNFRLVADHQMLPSWSVELRAVGNTFLHSNPEFSPKVELSTRHISFPPCRPGESVHQTLLIANSGDTPAAFSFGAPGALMPLFSVRPLAGVVPPKGHALVALRFSPVDTRPAAATARVIFNGVASNAVSLALRGCAHTPRLTTDLPSATLYFRPTCVGASSQRAISLHNPSRVPLDFRWRLPPKLTGMVTVTPASGTLRGNESVQLLWSFAPAAQKVFEGRATCLVLMPPEGGASGAASVASGLSSTVALGSGDSEAEAGGGGAGGEGDGVSLTLVGEGTQGAVALDPPALELGDLRVGHPVRRPLVLQNVSDGVLRYSLELVAAEDDEAPAADATACDFTAGLDAAATAAAAAAGLECWVDEPEGALPARASKTVTVTLFPRFRKRYSLQVRCRSSTVSPLLAGPNSSRPPSAGRASIGSGDATAADPAVAAAAALPPPVVAPLTACVTFPTLEVTDVYCEGQAKQLLWQMLGVNDLNHHLRTQVSGTELRLRAAHDRGSLTTEAACAAMRPFPMDFGTHGLGGRPRTVQIELTNPTPLPVSWQLHSFDDPDGVELENWVEQGRPRSEGERVRDQIAEHRLFEMRPRSGELEPGARGTVTVEFRPRVEGVFALPVFLHVTDGKRLRLQLEARSTSEARQLLALPPPLRTFRLEPVALGEPCPPLQMYTLRCGGPASVRWRLDTAPLDALAAESWGHRVLELVGPPEGHIPLGGVAAINWRFSPLEAKEYIVRVPVLLGDGGLEVIELVGRGYAPPSKPHHGAVRAVPVSEGAAAADMGLEADEAAAEAAATTAADRDWATWQGLSAAPSAGMAGRLAFVDHDLVSLGVTPLRGLTRRVIVLTNKSRYPLAFDWDLAALSPPPGVSGPPLPSADFAVLAGRPLQAALAISPSAGSLEPGERLVCRVALHAGVTPQLFEGEVRCNVRVDEEAMEEAAAAAGAAAAAAAEAEAALVERVEEVIAEDPAPTGPPPPPPAVAAAQRASKLRSRLPVHAYMTTAIRNRIEPLAQQFAATMETRTRRATEAVRGSLAVPEPQTICVTLTGRILDGEQMAALRYVPTHERHLARAAVTEGSCWVPPTLVPFWAVKQLPPPPARAAKAAKPLPPPPPPPPQPKYQRPLSAAISDMPSAADIGSSPHEGGAWPRLNPDPMRSESGGGSASGQVPDLSLNLAKVRPSEGGPTTPVLRPDQADGSDSSPVAARAAGGTGLGDSTGEVVDVTFGNPPGAAAAKTTAKDSLTGSEGSGSTSGAAAATTADEEEDAYGGDSGEEGAAAAAAGVAAATAAPVALVAAEGPAPPTEEVRELVPPPLPPPPPSGGGVDYGAFVSARDVLSGLFSELLDDPDLRRAFEFLPEAETPVFAEVRSQVAPCYDPGVRAKAGVASTVAPSTSSSQPVDTAQEQGQPQHQAEQPQQPVAADPAPDSLDEELAADPELRRVLASAEWQTLADYVLESALLGLMQESAAGDWDMPPEQQQQQQQRQDA
ncbi:Cilia- and flagella-associated protein 65 [Pleodorina starrii]|nr:Cilia- and flagella-associated protein 65 [Pleodorina starrii]